MKRSGKWNSLFRRKNSLFPAKNSLFRPAQGIGLQRIEIANRFPVFADAQGIVVQAFDLSDRLDTKNARKGRIRKNSLLNSLFSVLHRALPDLQGMKPGSTCCSHLLQRTTSVGLFLPREFEDHDRSFLPPARPLDMIRI